MEPPPSDDIPGLSRDAHSLYSRLAVDGPVVPDELDGDALDELLSTGLVVAADGAVEIVPPTGPLLELASRHIDRAVAAHRAIDDLMTVWRTARHGEVGVDVLTGAAAIHEYTSGIADSRREIVALSIGPRTGGTLVQAPGLIDALERGVSVRAVYHSRLFENQAALSIISACVAAGEEARVLPTVPVNLLVTDDFAAMNISYDGDGPMHVACTRNPRIVESWRTIFNSFWRQAMPFDPQGAFGADREEFRELVRLLSLGITDRAIARELGVSERTIGRRVTTLQRHLGVETRFQLGLQIAMRGWV
ncbi:helix-turn-helix transcriptional regulator [Agromyces sp. CCNWLW203]|uniref:helix-turn-helix transcriptional regulator n=1 Tax=Agromyces sp. CCNWLW203 TaxID=3112842 RepID=UPI002F9620C4